MTTDGDGRFVLKGIGRERVAEVYVDGVPDKASSLIVVATRLIDKPIVVPGETPEVKKLIAIPCEDLTIYGNQVDVKLAPGRSIDGVISDRSSGLPLSGVAVIGPWTTRLERAEFDRFHATTDKLGHYRIDGLPLMRGGFISPFGRLRNSLISGRKRLSTSAAAPVRSGCGSGQGRLDHRQSRGRRLGPTATVRFGRISRVQC